MKTGLPGNGVLSRRAMSPARTASCGTAPGSLCSLTVSVILISTGKFCALGTFQTGPELVPLAMEGCLPAYYFAGLNIAHLFAGFETLYRTNVTKTRETHLYN